MMNLSCLIVNEAILSSAQFDPACKQIFGTVRGGILS